MKNQITNIFKKINVKIKDINPLFKNDRVTISVVNNMYLIRISKFRLNTFVFESIKDIPYIQTLLHSGSFKDRNEVFYYSLCDYIEGDNLFDILPLKKVDSKRIGSSIASFLKKLHSIQSSHYDIGCYVKTVPNWAGSWIDGHIKYIDILKEGIKSVSLTTENEFIVQKAFDYMISNINALKYQSGSVLLHNDLHPKNIIIKDKNVEGIIDWECAQYGEVDYDFIHFLHWTLFPEERGKDFHEIVYAVFKEYKNLLEIPNIETRFTIYQLEHEINQMVWHNGANQNEKCSRLDGWLNQIIDKFIAGLKLD